MINMTDNTLNERNIFIKAFANLRWYEWVMFAAMIIIGAYYMVTDTSHPMWYLVLNYISSIAGVCCIFLTAHASWPNWLFAVVNTALYIVILAYNHVYGTMMLELIYYFPTNFIGLAMWKRHIDSKEKEKCKTRVMSWKERALMIAIVAAATLIYHQILVMVGGATAWLDAMTVAIGIIATFFEMKRFADQYILWLITDVIAVAQWIILADTIMITKKSIYLIMAVIGLVNWIKLKRERNEDNE